MAKIQYHITNKSIGGGGRYIAMLKEILGADLTISSIGSLTLQNIWGYLSSLLTCRNQPMVNVFGSQITLQLGVFLVKGTKYYMPHGLFHGQSIYGLRRNLLILTLRWSKIRVICCGYEEYENFIKVLGVSKCLLVPNTLNPIRQVEFKHRQKTFDYLPIDLAKKRVLFCGNGIPQKGLTELLKKWPAVGGSILLDVVGDHEHKNSYCELCLYQISTLENVQYLGEVSIKSDFLKIYDVVIISSKFEGLPFFGLECISAGLPLMIPNKPGCRELAAFSNTYLYTLESFDSFSVQLGKALDCNEYQKQNLDEDPVWSLYDYNTFKEFWINV